MNRRLDHPHLQTRRWLDSRGNIRTLYISLWIGCAILLLLELLIDKHVETAAEQWFGFHGFFGLIACVALVLAAKLLRRVIARPEDYYEPR